ncbi:hypothetical protein KCP76_08830 [Salmonella enterica subsp. enterica serovar Weltevreden]|nr:hypothetical protein KCP76_08830 [Salmonella enterica subsp. enterica serovar Weltevreden]
MRACAADKEKNRTLLLMRRSNGSRLPGRRALSSGKRRRPRFNGAVQTMRGFFDVLQSPSNRVASVRNHRSPVFSKLTAEQHRAVMDAILDSNAEGRVKR